VKMKKIRYLCIDDQPDEVGLELKKLQRTNPQLVFGEPSPPNSDFPTQIREIQTRRQDGTLDGLLIDLRLGQTAQTNEQPANYDAPLIASKLRTLMAQGKLTDFPIVLWSITSKLATSYNKDVSSHDLFDLVLNKGELEKDDPPAADQLASFAAAYDDVSARKRNSTFWTDLLCVPDGVELDPRIGEDLTLGVKDSPTHLLVRYVFEQIVQKPGPLIDEETLCARLGIEAPSLTSTTLAKTLDGLGRYAGPFSDTWRRWWWRSIEHWWKSVDDAIPPILSLTAAERVKKLEEVYGCKRLRPAKAIASGYSSRFTTICQCLRKPLDPIDGFMLSDSGFRPWHDRQYVCAQVALKPRLHRFDPGRLDAIEAGRAKALRDASK